MAAEVKVVNRFHHIKQVHREENDDRAIESVSDSRSSGRCL